MSSNRASSSGSGVRNLRAMFENHGNDGSPSPSRGRSPTSDDGPIRNGSKSPRPLSNVRASFVAVERSGQAGAQRTPKKSMGSDSIAEKRRSSFSLNQVQDTEALAEVTRTISNEKELRRKSTVITETVPEVAVETPMLEPTENEAMNLERGGDGRAVLPAEDAPSGNPDKPVSSVEEPSAKLRPADPTEQAVVSGDEALPESITKSIDQSHAPAAAEAADVTHSTPRSGPSVGNKLSPGDAETKSKGKPQLPPSPSKSPPAAKQPVARTSPAPISTSKAQEASQAKSPLKSTAKSPKTPTTPTATPKTAKAATPKTTPARAASKSTTPATSPNKPTRASLAPQTAASSSHAPSSNKPARASLAPQTASSAGHAAPSKARQPAVASSAKAEPQPSRSSDAGFVKPPPKSPTRPIRLPSHLTAPTASSVAKTSAAETGGSDQVRPRSPRRASTAGKGPSNTLDRSKSTRTNLPPSRATAGTTASNLHQRPSRASMPAQHANRSAASTDRPRSRVSAVGSIGGSKGGSSASDGGFLARMMRPTASSASKTHEKPATETGSGSRRASGAQPPQPRSGTRSSTASSSSAHGGSKRARVSGESVGSTSTHAKPEDVSIPEKPETAIALPTAEENTATEKSQEPKMATPEAADTPEGGNVPIVGDLGDSVVNAPTQREGQKS